MKRKYMNKKSNTAELALDKFNLSEFKKTVVICATFIMFILNANSQPAEISKQMNSDSSKHVSTSKVMIK